MKKLLPLLLLSLTLLLVAGTEPDFRPPTDKPVARPSVALENFHAAHVAAFVESPGRGAARTVQPPMWERQLMSVALPVAGSPSAIYQREQFSLVGLLNHATPMAYMTAASPHSPPIRGPLPMRAPDSFESGALARLRGGETLVTTQEPDGAWRMLGAVRARPDCIQCHDDNREGDLLGAFSYRLVPATPPQPKVESAPSSRQSLRP